MVYPDAMKISVVIHPRTLRTRFIAGDRLKIVAFDLDRHGTEGFRGGKIAPGERG
jgi:hypothetical protein